MANLIQKHRTNEAENIGHSPERELWVAVLTRAALDAFKAPPGLDMSLKQNRFFNRIYNYDRDQARHFFLEGGDYFREVCEMAGRNPTYVRERVKKLILKSNGWNTDVSLEKGKYKI